MSEGKYLSLEEARKYQKLERFSREHPSEGDMQFFDALLETMIDAKRQSKADGTSNKD